MGLRLIGASERLTSDGNDELAESPVMRAT